VIRINLMPSKRRAQVQSGSQAWLVVVLLLLVIQLGGLFFFHDIKAEELKTQQNKNAALKMQIEEAKRTVVKHDEVKAQLESLRAREDAIAQLQSARTGPAAVMNELTRILTSRGPSISPDHLNKLRRENPLAVYNPNWDPRRLWLTKFIEQQRKVRLEGLARDGEDVSELARRMNLSAYFSDVRLLPAKKSRDADSGLELVSFQLEAQARY
jgi:type IV pilus assembly protein PilN